VATLTFKTDKWCLGCSDESKNIIGKGLIIHAAAMIFIRSQQEMQEEWV
jgi:hypothetical protein